MCASVCVKKQPDKGRHGVIIKFERGTKSQSGMFLKSANLQGPCNTSGIDNDSTSNNSKMNYVQVLREHCM